MITLCVVIITLNIDAAKNNDIFMKITAIFYHYISRNFNFFIDK